MYKRQDFRYAVEANKKITQLIAKYGSVENVPKDELLILALVEGASYDASGRLTVPGNCGLNGNRGDCQIALDQLLIYQGDLIDRIKVQLSQGYSAGEHVQLSKRFRNFILVCAEVAPDLLASFVGNGPNAHFDDELFKALAGDTAQLGQLASSRESLGFDGDILLEAINAYRISGDNPEAHEALQVSIAYASQVFRDNHTSDALNFLADLSLGITAVGSAVVAGGEITVLLKNGRYYLAFATGAAETPIVGKLFKVGGEWVVEQAGRIIPAPITDAIADSIGTRIDNAAESFQDWVDGGALDIPYRPSPGITTRADGTIVVDSSRASRGTPEYDLLNDPAANTRYELDNGTKFTTNSDGYVEEISYSPSQTSVPRDARQTAVGKLGINGDVGGHIQACSQGGTCHRFNLFPQNGNFNNSAYKKFENEISSAMRAGNLDGPIVIKFTRSNPNSARPDRLTIDYSVNGESVRRRFNNSAGG